MSSTAVPPVDIHVTEADGKVEVTAWAGAEHAGVMVLSRLSADRLLIEHTQTFTGHEGRGVGKRLVAAGVEWARSTGQRLMPLCPFARQLFDRCPEYGDVRSGL